MAKQKFRKQRDEYRTLTQVELIRKEVERKRTQERRNRRKLKEFFQ